MWLTSDEFHFPAEPSEKFLSSILLLIQCDEQPAELVRGTYLKALKPEEHLRDWAEKVFEESWKSKMVKRKATRGSLRKSEKNSLPPPLFSSQKDLSILPGLETRPREVFPDAWDQKMM